MGWFSKSDDQKAAEQEIKDAAEKAAESFDGSRGGEIVEQFDHPDPARSDIDSVYVTRDGSVFETNRTVQQQLDENSGFGDD